MAGPEDHISVVFDIGSQSSKAGFANEPFPRCVIPTAVGRCRRSGLTDGFPDFVFGKEAIRLQGVTDLKCPMTNGFVNNWDDMEKLLHHIFYKDLHVPPEQANIMYIIHPLSSRVDKEKIAEILFESFMVPNIYLGVSPALVLHASGRTSGVVWENGYSCSYAAPVFEGFLLRSATITSQISGNVMTDMLRDLMSSVGYSFTTHIERKILEDIKSHLCYVARDYELELKSFADSRDNVIRYDLPDGQHVMVGEERFKCPEMLFQPNLFGLKCPSVIDDICHSIEKCDMDYNSLFHNNVVISGGSSLFTGMSDRLSFELNKRGKDRPGVTSHIDAMPSRSLAAWVGGSILASLNSFNGFWMSREEYDDCGPNGSSYKFI